MFFKIGVLKYFAILTGKHLYWNVFFNKVAGLDSFFNRKPLVAASAEKTTSELE